VIRAVFQTGGARVAGAALLALSVAAARPSQAEDGKIEPPSITVEGTASADVAPDTVVVRFGVVVERSGAADAMRANSKAVADAIAQVKAEGVKPEDIATTNATLTPEMSPSGKTAPRVVGYKAENQLEVRLRPVDKAGEILGHLVDKGINAVESVAPLISDDTALRDRLRADAARDARRKAEIYAAALHLTLGPVTRIDPEAYAVAGRFPMAAKVMAAPAPVPVEAGQQTVTEAVRVTFSLQQP
jgi:uncharacterized protein